MSTEVRDVYDPDDELSSTGDLISASGLDRIMQKAIRLLLLDPGELIHRASLGAGLSRLAGKPSIQFELDTAYNSAKRTLEALEEIESFTLEFKIANNALMFDLSITVNGAALTRRNVRVD